MVAVVVSKRTMDARILFVGVCNFDFYLNYGAVLECLSLFSSKSASNRQMRDFNCSFCDRRVGERNQRAECSRKLLR